MLINKSPSSSSSSSSTIRSGKLPKLETRRSLVMLDSQSSSPGSCKSSKANSIKQMMTRRGIMSIGAAMDHMRRVSQSRLWWKPKNHKNNTNTNNNSHYTVKGGILAFSVFLLLLMAVKQLRRHSEQRNNGGLGVVQLFLPQSLHAQSLLLVNPKHFEPLSGPHLFAGKSPQTFLEHGKEENFLSGSPGQATVLKETPLHAGDGNMNSDHSNPLGLSNPMKVYVYDLPPSFNEDWLNTFNEDGHGGHDHGRCSNHLFAAEVAIHKRLLSSPVRTLKPWEADFFFVPVYVSCNFNTSTGFPSLAHARSLLRSAVKLVSRHMPYWNRSLGKDHVFVATHDYGACFHTMEDVAIAAGIPSFLRNSIILQTFGQTSSHACQPPHNQNVQIPPFVPPSSSSSVDPEWHPEKQARDIWAYFRGKIELHPKNVSGRIYSRGVRSMIWQRFRHNRRFFIERSRSPDYHMEISRSVFCLCPLGWAPWSPRIVEAVIFGCVPVIIADEIALPYSHLIDWPRISVGVPEKEVSRLGKILDNVARTNLSTIQENLWKSEYRKALLYMDPLTKGDATWQALDLLSRRLTPNRSSG